VAAGRIHYWVGAQGILNVQNDIATWVAQHYTASTVDGVTVYDLTARP
jgi:hypothetical protein